MRVVARDPICFTGPNYQPGWKAATSGKAAVFTWRMAESPPVLARLAGVRPNAQATDSCSSRTDSLAGERARLGRCGRAPPPATFGGPLKTAHYLSTPCAPRPPGEGAGEGAPGAGAVPQGMS